MYFEVKMHRFKENFIITKVIALSHFVDLIAPHDVMQIRRIQYVIAKHVLNLS